MTIPVFGNIEPRSLLSLRVSFGLLVLLAWNAGFLYARYLGAPLTRSGLVVGGLCGCVSGLVAFAITTTPSVRNVVPHPVRSRYYEPGMFRFIAFVCLFVGLGWLAMGLLLRGQR